MKPTKKDYLKAKAEDEEFRKKYGEAINISGAYKIAYLMMHKLENTKENVVKAGDAQSNMEVEEIKKLLKFVKKLEEE